jgi:hypothetical protein
VGSSVSVRIGSLLDCVIREVDVATGRAMLEWRASDHVALAESYQPRPKPGGGPWDFFHANAVTLDADGHLLISTWTRPPAPCGRTANCCTPTRCPRRPRAACGELPARPPSSAWGQQPYFSEYAADGTPRYDAQLLAGDYSYRAFRSSFDGTPADRPAVAVTAGTAGQNAPAAEVTVHVSWNGATRAAR